MSLQAELDHDEQSVLDYSEMQSQRSWSIADRQCSFIRRCRN